jgi:hypothetical protein
MKERVHCCCILCNNCRLWENQLNGALKQLDAMPTTEESSVVQPSPNSPIPNFQFSDRKDGPDGTDGTDRIDGIDRTDQKSVTSQTAEPSPTHGKPAKLCKRSLHKFPGVIISPCGVALSFAVTVETSADKGMWNMEW